MQPAVSGPGADQEQATQRPSLRSHHPGTHTHTHSSTHTCGCISTCRLYVLTCVTFVQECEASPHCRRLQLKDLLVSEMQRLTKYPLLLDNIIKHTEGEESWRSCEHEAMCQKKESNFLRCCFFIFSFSRYVGPPLAPARPGVLQRDTAGRQRSRQGNRTPATPQPIPTQAGRCPSIQGSRKLFFW